MPSRSTSEDLDVHADRCVGRLRPSVGSQQCHPMMLGCYGDQPVVRGPAPDPLRCQAAEHVDLHRARQSQHLKRPDVPASERITFECSRSPPGSHGHSVVAAVPQR